MEVVAYIVIYAFIFVIGIVVGSFLNVVIWRVPQKMPFSKGRSVCPDCGHQIREKDLVPIFSYLALKGKCRDCGGKISARYPLVEALMGVLAVLAFVVYGFSWQAVVVAYCAAPLISIAMIDIDTMEIPDGLVIALIPAAVAAIFAFPGVGIVERLIGLAAVSGPMLLLALFITDAFGGGDIKLMAVCGFLLGWKGVLVAMFIALLTGGIYGVILMAKKKAKGKTSIAFGEFLCIGVMAALLAGQPIVDWYQSLLVI